MMYPTQGHLPVGVSEVIRLILCDYMGLESVLLLIHTCPDPVLMADDSHMRS